MSSTKHCIDHGPCDALEAGHLCNRPDRQAPCPTCGEAPGISSKAPRPGDNVKIGDLLYAVGPGHHAPHGPMDLRIYSTPVVAFQLDGPYSGRCQSVDLAGAVFAIELSGNRPVLGFPQWTYKSYEVGIKVHCSAIEALRAFMKQWQLRYDEAKRALDRADSEIKWAADQIQALCTEAGR